jgi:glycosyltransferase involved in cell wall biosynthesis
MRVLFVSGSASGGSLRSTSELAQRLARRGHAVAILKSARGGRFSVYVHKRADNLEAKLAPRPVSRVVAAGARLIGRRPRPMPAAPQVELWQALLPENAFGAILRRFAPDVVVANSIDRRAWRKIRADLAAKGIASVLYLREESAVGHITVSNAPADLHLANAEVHSERMRALGLECITIPSLIEVDQCLVESTRECVQFVNPVDISGVDIAIELAHARPAVSFVFAESWKLDPDERAVLDERLRGLLNVEFRERVEDLRLLYRDARVLLAPYLTNGRPRVALEAQANGIPVLATDIPALREAVGPGGVLVDPEAPVADWAAALDAMLEPARYDELTRLARAHAARAEVDPEEIVACFERALSDLLEGAATG